MLQSESLSISATSLSIRFVIDIHTSENLKSFLGLRGLPSQYNLFVHAARLYRAEFASTSDKNFTSNNLDYAKAYFLFEFC